MNMIISCLGGSIVRHLSQILMTALATSGWFSGDEVTTLAGAAGILATLAWSQIDAWLKAQKIKLAKS